MRIAHLRDKSTTSYTLGTTQLKDVNSFKDLGVSVTCDLSWGNHVNKTVNKANGVLGIIKRSVGTENTDIFSILYQNDFFAFQLCQRTIAFGF